MTAHGVPGLPPRGGDARRGRGDFLGRTQAELARELGAALTDGRLILRRFVSDAEAEEVFADHRVVVLPNGTYITEAGPLVTCSECGWRPDPHRVRPSWDVAWHLVHAHDWDEPHDISSGRALAQATRPHMTQLTRMLEHAAHQRGR